MLIDKLKSLLRPKALLESAEPPRSSSKTFKGESGLHQLYSAGDFQQVLQQERHAADETGREFSLLIFEFNDNAPNDAPAQKLWQAIHRRMRRRDKAGWLSSQSFGVILPETPFADGRKVAEDVCRTLEAAMPFVSYKILTYPPRHDPSS
jgi:PleD family two-component response regulator